MKVFLVSTSKIVEANGVPARIWEGQTDSGIKCHAFITRIAVAKEDDCSEFERELQECVAPSPAVQAIDARLVL